MAIIKTIRTPTAGTAAVYEDPVPNSPYIFFQHDAYNKTSLAPQFDTAMNWNTQGYVSFNDAVNGTNHSGFGFNPLHGVNRSSAGASTIWTYAYPLTGTLQLNGEVTHVRQQIFNTNNDYRNNLDIAPFASMDDSRKIKPMNYFTDGTYNTVIGVAHLNQATNDQTYNTVKYWIKANTSSADLVISSVTTNTVLGAYQSTAGWPNGGYQLWPVYRNPSSGNLVWAGQGNYWSGGPYVPAAIRGISSSPAFGGTPTFASPSGSGTTQASSQFVGVSVNDGYAIYLQNNTTTDYNQTFYKFNDSNNSNTALDTFTAAPGIAGTSQGGNRAASYGGYMSKYASKTFSESGTVTGFYLPFVDSTGIYCPLYFQWNRTTDSFTRNADVSITYPGVTTQSNYWAPETSSAWNDGWSSFNMQRLWANETFTYSGTRYLLFMQLHGAGGISDAVTAQRTFVCYSVNASNPKLLTYHSKIEVPTTPKNIVWLNDARTILGIIAHSNLYIYTFNGTTWTQTANLQYQFHAVGRDNLGRIWAHDAGFGHGRIHLITLSVPVTISVVPAASSYQYSGSTVTSTLAVNAYDSSGARIATSVKLVIDGGSMTFSGNNLTTTVTTSATVDTNVAISITNGGISNVIASAAL